MKKILKNLAAAAMLGLVFCTGVTSHASNGNVVLVLDPGHDVHDAGARRTWNGVTYAEETITLKMAQYCKEELEKYSGIVVYMTRFSNNVDMDRYDRVKVAKDLGADALVSLHINSTGNQQDTVSGALAYLNQQSRLCCGSKSTCCGYCEQSFNGRNEESRLSERGRTWHYLLWKAVEDPDHDHRAWICEQSF